MISILALIVFTWSLILMALDVSSTLDGLKMGLIESNPVGVFLKSLLGAWWWLPEKILVLVVILFFWASWGSYGALVASSLACLITGYAVWNNYNLLKRLHKDD